MIELLGLVAGAIILVSFLFKKEKNIRIMNMVGSGLWLIYGIVLGLSSVVFMNVAMILIHIYMLRRTE